MDADKWFLLSKLKRAVNKIKFLLNLNVNRLKLASMIGATSKIRLSFRDDNKPGLISFVHDEDSDSSDTNEPGSATSGTTLQRTIIYPPPPSSSLEEEEEENDDGDDVDKRAEAFIANFYKQLHIERQISLELRYNRERSFDSVGESPR